MTYEVTLSNASSFPSGTTFSVVVKNNTDGDTPVSKSGLSSSSFPLSGLLYSVRPSMYWVKDISVTITASRSGYKSSSATKTASRTYVDNT